MLFGVGCEIKVLAMIDLQSIKSSSLNMKRVLTHSRNFLLSETFGVLFTDDIIDVFNAF